MNNISMKKLVIIIFCTLTIIGCRSSYDTTVVREDESEVGNPKAMGEVFVLSSVLGESAPQFENRFYQEVNNRKKPNERLLYLRRFYTSYTSSQTRTGYLTMSGIMGVPDGRNSDSLPCSATVSSLSLPSIGN